MSFYEKNFSLLEAHDPYLARRVKDTGETENIKILQSKSGHPIPQIASISLHSHYRPIEEAHKFALKARELSGKPLVVYGLGFGYHVEQLLNATLGTIWVIEPFVSLFKSFLEHVDLAPFLPRIRFVIGEPLAKITSRILPEEYELLTHPPSVQVSKPYHDRLLKTREASDWLRREKLKVMVINPIYGGSLPTAQYSYEALQQLGHETAVVNCDAYSDSFFSVKKVTRNRKHSEVLSAKFMDMMSEVIVARAAEFQPDFILALAQAPLNPPTIQRLKTLGVPLAFWFVEDFRTLTYWRELASSYDYFFTIQKEDFYSELDSVGQSSSYYLPQACSRKMHRPIVLDELEKSRFGSDLSFMGAAYYNRVQTFPRLTDFDFKIWGTGWDTYPLFKQRLQKGGERISGEESARIYNASRINLNLHSSTFHEGVNPLGDFVNPRVFEIAGCGAFQLVDRRKELDELFDVGREMIVFDSIPELREQIFWYLEHETERSELGQKARARVIREHTMNSRMQEMLTHVFTDHMALAVSRIKERSRSIDSFIARAGKDSELGRYLERFKDEEEFSIKSITRHIETSEGTLSKNELLLLMVDQLVREGEGDG